MGGGGLDEVEISKQKDCEDVLRASLMGLVSVYSSCLG